jgi:formylglycine-generating enzyme required for sulfatase activity
MTAVAAGRIELANPGKGETGAPTDVGGFWIDECEVTVEEFQAFLAALPERRAAVDALIASLPWLSQLDNKDAFARIDSPPPSLGGRTPPKPRWPIEQVSYAQALTYVTLKGKDLPTLQEWWLAAKGSLTQYSAHRAFPWSSSSRAGLDGAATPRDVWGKGQKLPTDVDNGGRVVDLDDVHHLSGNVEEWTRVEIAAGAAIPQACAVGGAYTDTDPDLFSGAARRYYDVDAPPALHVGFRGVLRPLDFFSKRGGGEDLVPKGL